jgi:hypothetical protein
MHPHSWPEQQNIGSYSGIGFWQIKQRTTGFRLVATAPA